MQNFIGWKWEWNDKTLRFEKKYTECVANDRREAARRMKVELKTVCLAN